MTSNLFSRLLPSVNGSPSVYETITQHEQALNDLDVEHYDELAIDEDNFAERFHDQDLEEVLEGVAESQVTTENTTLVRESQQRRPLEQRRTAARDQSGPRWKRNHPEHPGRSEVDDDDVPESLLLEDDHEGIPAPTREIYNASGLPPPVPGPSTGDARVQWGIKRGRQKLEEEDRSQHGTQVPRTVSLNIAGPEDQAMWRWTNVENLDNFLNEVYEFYVGKGFWSIMLAKALQLLSLAFVGGFGIFLTFCVNYDEIPTSKTMPQIVQLHCTQNMSRFGKISIWLFSFLWISGLFLYLLDIPRLWHVRDFYLYLLGISDQETQTISWQDIVSRLMNLRDANPHTALNVSPRSRKLMGHQSKQRMDAHDIANRLMRRDNYLIALFNKDILDLTVPIPFLKNRQVFSKTLESYIGLCVIDFVFNKEGQVKQLFLKDTCRRDLIVALRHRFVIAGFASIVEAPFKVTFHLMHYFLRYFTEFQRHPSQLSLRSYTPLAEWKFREFNELRHLFQRRTDMSYPFAARYIDQFPKDKTVQVARFVAFIAGALAAVLAVASLLDPDLFLDFEITPQRTVLFYLGIFGSIWALARGILPEENQVFDPEYACRTVIEWTHYEPAQWKDRLHSDDVRKEFSTLYQMKILIFVEEILSMVFTPFVLWFSLPNCSESLIDFFREFTVHVDGLGYVCSFALFDFKIGVDHVRGNKVHTGARVDPRDDYYSTKDGKMLSSYFGFVDSYANYSGRTGNRHGKRRNFHAPPSFPAISSPPPTTRAGGATGKRSENRLINTAAHPRYSSPISRLAASHASPSPSLLLDPHHQPSTTFSRLTSRAPKKPKFISRRTHLAEYDEDDEGEGQASLSPQKPITSSVIMEGDSNLGNSWKMTMGGNPGDDDGSEIADITNSAGDKGIGVLGLLYQFQKAQIEGRGATVNI